MAFLTSGALWPALATRTPLDQSIQRLPYLSYTEKSSARSQTSGGWPRMETGSNLRKISRVARDSGCGKEVTMRRYLVSIRGSDCGLMLNSLPIFFTHSIVVFSKCSIFPCNSNSKEKDCCQRK